MRNIQRGLMGAVMICIIASMNVPVDASEKLVVTPARIDINGTNQTIETRTILIQASGLVDNLRVDRSDLTCIANQSAFAADRIYVKLKESRLDTGGVLTVPVTFDMKGARIGSYSGEIFIGYNGGSLALPVTVNIKAQWPLPLAVMIAGILLGIVVSRYREGGKIRDRILVNMGRLRTQMRTDPDLAKPFRIGIESHMVDIEVSLQAEKWQEAQEAFQKADTMLAKWRKGRADWLALLTFLKMMGRRLKEEDMNLNIPFLQAVHMDIEDNYRRAPEMDGPDKLQEKLETLADQINNYICLQTQLEKLAWLYHRLPPELDSPWRFREKDLQKKLHEMNPHDANALQDLKEEIETAISELAQLVLETGKPESDIQAVRSLDTTLLNLLGPVPQGHPISLTSQPDAAKTRFEIFSWVSYGIVLLILAGSGFNELYLTRPDFGTRMWSDYFSLMAWGFGAEATRMAITEVVQGWRN